MPDLRAQTEKPIFISYSRANRAFALELRQKLADLGFKLWRDIEDMPIGEKWWPSLQEAIRACENVVLCMSPEALVSKNVADEWQYAREQGKRVMPVVAAEVDFAAVSRWMGRFDWADFRPGAKDADLVWARFVNQLNTPYIPRKVPFMVEALPPDYVKRPAETDALINALVDSTPGAVAISAALRGTGGYGKTTLARAICHDARVRSAFDDGILWVTLGEAVSEQELISKILDLVEILTSHRPTMKSLDAAGTELRKAIGDGYLLLVIDDAWQASHLKPFLNPGKNAATLITTRNAGVLPGEAIRIDVDAMQTSEAVQLLRYKLSDGEGAAVTALTARLGEWPLLLKLVNSALRKRIEHGETLKIALDWVEKALGRKGFAAFDDPNDQGKRNSAVSATLGVSFELLDSDQQVHYERLAIFPEDVDIPLVALKKLWKLDDFDVEELCQRYAELSLLLSYNLSTRTIRLHDVVHTYLRDTHRTDWQKWNDDFLDAYGAHGATPKGTGWHTIEDDGYLYDHLAYHLKEKGDYSELKALFANHEWLHARVEQSGYTYEGYITDLMIAWEDFAYPEALRQIEMDIEPTALAECIRYALIRTSLNSFTGNYVPKMVARAVETGLWTAQRSLSVAENIPDANQKVELYTLLLETAKLSKRELESATKNGLAAAFTIQDEGFRVEALVALAPHLSDKVRKQAMVAGLAAAFTIQDEGERVWALVALAPHLSGEARKQALAAAFALPDEWERARALANLAPYLSGEARKQALAAALAFPDERFRVWVLAALAPHLSGEARKQALAAAFAIQREGFHVDMLVALAPHLSGEARKQALAAALVIQDKGSRARVLAALAPHLSGEARKQALAAGLAAALVIQDKGSRAQVLAALAPYLSGEARKQALAAGLAAALVIRDEKFRVQVLAALAPHLSGEAREQALAAGLAAALVIQHEGFRVEALVALAPHLSGEAREQALAATLALQHEGFRVEALAVLAPYLSGEAREQALAAGLVAVFAIQDEGSRARALAALAPHLSGEVREQALAAGLAAASAIRDEKFRVQVLAALAPHLSGDLREQALTAGLAAAFAIRKEVDRATALAALVPSLSGEAREQALAAGLAATFAIRYEEEKRAQALAALAPHLSGEAREQALTAGLAAALVIQGKWEQARVLATLAPHLSGEAREQALAAGLAAASAIQDEGERVWALVALAPHLSGELLVAELAATFAIQDERERVQVLAALAPHLSGEARQQALVAALALPTKWFWSRATALTALAPHLSGEARQQALVAGLAAACAIQDEGERADALVALAPHLSGELLVAGLTATFAIQDEKHRIWALVALAPSLTSNQSVLNSRIRQSFAKSIILSQKQTRAYMLRLGGDGFIFLKLSPAVLESIAHHIIEICNEWEWL